MIHMHHIIQEFGLEILNCPESTIRHCISLRITASQLTCNKLANLEVSECFLGLSLFFCRLFIIAITLTVLDIEQLMLIFVVHNSIQ